MKKSILILGIILMTGLTATAKRKAEVKEVMPLPPVQKERIISETIKAVSECVKVGSGGQKNYYHMATFGYATYRFSISYVVVKQSWLEDSRGVITESIRDVQQSHARFKDVEGESTMGFDNPAAITAAEENAANKCQAARQGYLSLLENR